MAGPHAFKKPVVGKPLGPGPSAARVRPRLVKEPKISLPENRTSQLSRLHAAPQKKPSSPDSTLTDQERLEQAGYNALGFPRARSSARSSTASRPASRASQQGSRPRPSSIPPSRSAPIPALDPSDPNLRFRGYPPPTYGPYYQPAYRPYYEPFPWPHAAGSNQYQYPSEPSWMSHPQSQSEHSNPSQSEPKHQYFASDNHEHHHTPPPPSVSIGSNDRDGYAGSLEIPPSSLLNRNSGPSAPSVDLGCTKDNVPKRPLTTHERRAKLEKIKEYVAAQNSLETTQPEVASQSEVCNIDPALEMSIDKTLADTAPAVAQGLNACTPTPGISSPGSHRDIPSTGTPGLVPRALSCHVEKSLSQSAGDQNAVQEANGTTAKVQYCEKGTMMDNNETDIATNIEPALDTSYLLGVDMEQLIEDRLQDGRVGRLDLEMLAKRVAQDDGLWAQVKAVLGLEDGGSLQ